MERERKIMYVCISICTHRAFMYMGVCVCISKSEFTIDKVLFRQTLWVFKKKNGKKSAPRRKLLSTL